MNSSNFPVYAVQRGAGLGNVLTGLAKVAVPLVMPLLKSVGKSMLLKGAEALDGKRTGPGVRIRKRTRTPSGRPVRKKVRRKRDIFS